MGVKVACAALLGVLVLAGCGSKKSNASPAVAWADSFCSAATAWKDSVTSAADSIKQGNVSRDSLTKAANDVSDATQTFAKSVRKLGAPPTNAGDQAKQQVDDLSQQIDDGVTKIQDAVQGASGITGTLNAISVASSTLASMGGDVSTTYSELQKLDPKGELTKAIDQSASCQKLRGTG